MNDPADEQASHDPPADGAAEGGDGSDDPDRADAEGGDPGTGRSASADRAPGPEQQDGDAATGQRDGDADESTDLDALREQVEAEYDFEDFGPSDMAEMSADEWTAAFDPDTWITGDELLDRVEADLKQRVANRDVFARIERRDDHLVAYSDSGYATVYPDGSVEGQGTVLRDVKPTVALCSMDSYDVPDEPPGELLPDPAEVPEGSGDFGNLMLQLIAGSQILAGIALIGTWLLVSIDAITLSAQGGRGQLNVYAVLFAGLAFVAIGVFLFMVVANARLSDRFRAEEYRNRLRAIELEPDEQPDFLPDPDDIERIGEEGGDQSGSTD